MEGKRWCMTTAHTSLGLPHGLVYVRVGGREVLHEVTRGLSRGLGGVQPALCGVGRLRRGNQPFRAGSGRAQEMRVCLGVEFTTHSAAPPLLIDLLCAPNAPRLFPWGLFPAPPTPSPPDLPPRSAAAKTGRADCAAPGILWACSVAGPLCCREGASSLPQGGGGACGDCRRAPACHTFGGSGAAQFSGSPERPPTPSLPASGGRASQGGAEAGVRPLRCRQLLRKYSSAGEWSRAPHRPRRVGRGRVGGGLSA